MRWSGDAVDLYVRGRGRVLICEVVWCDVLLDWVDVGLSWIGDLSPRRCGARRWCVDRRACCLVLSGLGWKMELSDTVDGDVSLGLCGSHIMLT